jgi:hypothetical protein
MDKQVDINELIKDENIQMAFIHILLNHYTKEAIKPPKNTKIYYNKY